jgi:hypothetical protein
VSKTRSDSDEGCVVQCARAGYEVLRVLREQLRDFPVGPAWGDLSSSSKEEYVRGAQTAFGEDEEVGRSWMQDDASRSLFFGVVRAFAQAIGEARTLLSEVSLVRLARSTPDQLEAQRRSFAYGNVKLANDAVTREMVDEVAEKARGSRE